MRGGVRSAGESFVYHTPATPVAGRMPVCTQFKTVWSSNASKTYMCSSQGKLLCFIIDFGTGFTCFENISKNVLWKYKFSQLKGSSDDGKTRVKLLFQNSDTKQIEMKELEFADLTAVLHCIHSFVAAKVAAVDPLFIDSQSFARKYMYSS
ncbi:SNTG2 protein, partial [Polyodon spathula]|nr:SNTG2 protein [Polyodon spathula]